MSATFAHALRRTATEHPDAPAVRTLDGSVELTWSEVLARSEAIARGLAGLGVGRGDTVALLLSNRPEFHLCDHAALQLGATPFSIYNTYAPEQIEYVVADSGAKVAITERALMANLLAARANLPGLEHVVVIDGNTPDGCVALDDLERSNLGFDVEATAAAVQPDDVLSLIYTSGTTGPPKGVELTHHNVLTMLDGASKVLDLGAPGWRVISWLPAAHIAERAAHHYLPTLRAGSISCCADGRQVAEALKEVRPTWFFAVPRVWEKLKAGLEANGVTDPAVLPDEARTMLRARLGLDQAQALHVGAAPTPAEVISFFHALGLPLGELWGLSESCGVATITPPGSSRIGTVGVAVPGVEVALADDGELLIRGATVMKGYRNQPDKTAEAIDADGWLHTGDIGTIAADGFVTIIDRKKELIINAAGKNMSPAYIEARIKAASPLIGQAVCIGDSMPYNTALIVLDPDVAAGREPDDPETRRLVQDGIDRANARLSRVEQIKTFTILSGDWAPGGEELTPTMKLKRKPIAAKYAAEIKAMY